MMQNLLFPLLHKSRPNWKQSRSLLQMDRSHHHGTLFPGRPDPMHPSTNLLQKGSPVLFLHFFPQEQAIFWPLESVLLR